ncbi:endothelin-converting enzyme homolog [Sycon ciliatum]|uniref:endothelin-converting enzyme homolog n=1 Tax=Sycon ciliatum TaxID=27933 RepID=UPI0020ACB3BA|eukprot:scpid23369/ scgid25349/ Endothelin-converting enzyme 1
MAVAGKAQYYRLVNQETDSDGEAVQEKAKVVTPTSPKAKGASPLGQKQRRQRTNHPSLRYGWSPRASIFFCMLIAALVLLAILVIVALRPSLNNNGAGTTAPPPAVCSSSACVQLSGAVASMANFSADPCDNLWQYACGRLLDKLVLHDYVARWSWYDQLEKRTYERVQQIFRKMKASSTDSVLEPSTAAKKAARLYETCTNTNAADKLGVAPLKQFVSMIGGWNASGWSDLKSDLTKALALTLDVSLRDISDNNQLSPFFAVSTSKDDKVNVSIFKIRESGLGMASRSLYLSNSSSSVSTAYQRFMSNFANALSDDGATQLQLQSDLADVYRFEVELANITTPSADLRDPMGVYNKRTLRNVSTILTTIDWVVLLQTLYPDSAGSINLDTEVILDSPEYYSQLSQLIMSTPQRTLGNYISWLVARTTAPLLSQPLRTAYDGYKKALKGVTGIPRNLYCLKLVDQSMPLAVGRLFIDDVFDSSSVKKGSDLMSSIIQAFKSNLPNVKWMDSATQAVAAEKADAILYQIGYSVEYANRSAIESLYSQLNVSTRSLFTDIMAAWRLERSRTGSLYVTGKPVSRKYWDMRPTQANAFYEPTLNVIGIPGGILGRPFFDQQAPAAFNYGAIGTVMGHELSHGFDDQGRHYDKNGSLRQWWSATASLAFNEHADCIVKQYDNYTVLNSHLKGKLALGENIADIGGLKIAYKAYREYVQQHGDDLPLSGLEHLTGDQLYFLSHAQYQCSKATREELLRRLQADVHSPLKWRVMGPSMDMPEYAKAFNCTAGSKMNPEQRCTIW